MTASGSATARQLAKALGLTGYDSPKRVERWLRGENRPRYDETIALLELAGWLNVSRAEAGLAAAQGALAEAEEAERRLRGDDEPPAREERETG